MPPVETRSAAVGETFPRQAASLPTTRFSARVDGLILRLGRWCAWLWLLLVGVILCNVILRYSFGEGRIELEELQWHLFAAGFLIAIPMAVVTNDHIRVDLLHERFSPRTQAWIELYGTLLLLLPFTLLVLIFALPFAGVAWLSGEVSQAPGGLPYRWLIKAVLPLSFVLLLLAATARLSRATSLLFGWPRAIDHSGADVKGTRHGGE